ncbi:MAG TPA: hypothetical protein VF050_00990 [Moraxellaceae bacterium]
MKSLTVQLQPDLAPGLDIPLTRSAIEAVAKTDIVVSHSFSAGEDGGPYLNFTFCTFNPRALWLQLSQSLYPDNAWGENLKNSTIVACEGSRGWDNYLLLHHFDRSVALDDPGDL